MAHETDDPDPPPGVGPHELRELELMLAGKKPAAMFSDAVIARWIIPEDAFEPHVQAGRIIKRVVFEPNPGSFDAIRVYYALPGEEWRIDALDAINNAIHSKLRPATGQDDIDTGRLLGYTEEEIAIYLAWVAHAWPPQG
ncbi:hypothetical protein [Ferrovibrio sp.]|uniref:hypothetical protein n=1 Tax=Ferrovibrio sp. TaxID=1917215 RepID=UPI003D0E7002